MLEEQRNCLELGGHFQPATLSSLWLMLSGCHVTCLVWEVTLQHQPRVRGTSPRPFGPEEQPLCKKRHYGRYLARGKRWVQFCLSARGLCSPRAKVTHFSLALVTPQALGSIEPSVLQGLLSRLPHRPAVLRPTRRPLFPRLFQVGVSAVQPYSAWPDRAILTARTTREAR